MPSLPSTPPVAASPPETKVMLSQQPPGVSTGLITISSQSSAILSQVPTPEHIETVTIANMDSTPISSPSCHMTPTSDTTYKHNTILPQQFKTEIL
jgi:hypothetical protein